MYLPMSLFRLPPLSRSLSLLAAPRGFSIAFLYIHYVSLCSVSLSLSLSPSRPLSSHQPLVKRFFFFSPSFFSMRFCFCFCHCLQRSIFSPPPFLPLFSYPAYPSSPPRDFSSFFPLFPRSVFRFGRALGWRGGGGKGRIHVAAGITERCFDSCFNGCSAYTRLTRPDAFQFSRNAS